MLAIKSKKRFEYCSGLTVEISAPAYTKNWDKRRKKEEPVFYLMLLSLRMSISFMLSFQNQRLETQTINCGPQAESYWCLFRLHRRTLIINTHPCNSYLPFLKNFLFTFHASLYFHCTSVFSMNFYSPLAMLPTDSPADSDL